MRSGANRGADIDLVKVGVALAVEFLEAPFAALIGIGGDPNFAALAG
jgi:hypothetical protein